MEKELQILGEQISQGHQEESVEITQIEKDFERLYLERKGLIKISDQKLIAWSKGSEKESAGSNAFHDETSPVLRRILRERRDIIQPRFKGRRIIDIGSGPDMANVALYTFARWDKNDRKFHSDISSAPSEFIGIDLFMDQERANSIIRTYIDGEIDDLPDDQKQDMMR